VAWALTDPVMIRPWDTNAAGITKDGWVTIKSGSTDATPLPEEPRPRRGRGKYTRAERKARRKRVTESRRRNRR